MNRLISAINSSSFGDMSQKPVFANEIKPPRCATWLPKNAKKIWRQIVNANPPDWFRDSDLPLLESYCLSYSQMRDAVATVETEGSYVNNAAGSLIAHPGLKIIHDSTSRMTTMAVKLRICPNARHSDNAATSSKANRSMKPTEASSDVVRPMFGR